MQAVDGYQLIEEIGRGGMATVYKALQPSLGRYVALKVLPPYFARDEEFVNRFRHEALAVAKLRHPNIVQVFNFHQDDDLFCLAMEYIDGGSLADLLKVGRQLSLNLSIKVASQIAAALYHAHQTGFIHRDIKPSNILLTPDYQAVLTDFGITKALYGTKLTKTTGFSGGTLEYMSPEQAKGEAVDGRSDLYSLGIVWYEMLAGRCPFEGDNPLTVIQSQIYEKPKKPSDFNPEIPLELESIILKLLEKEPGKRYKDGLELIAAISGLKVSDNRVVNEDSPTLPKAALDKMKTRLKPIRRPVKDELKQVKSVTGRTVKGENAKKNREENEEHIIQNKSGMAVPVKIFKETANKGRDEYVNKVKTGRFKLKRLIAGAITAICLSVVPYSMFSGNTTFHHQFNPIITRTGGASVAREVNIQTDGDRKSLIVALRIKGGRGVIEYRESLPKTLAGSSKNIDFNIKPTSIIRNGAAAMWRLKAKKTVTTIVYRSPAPDGLDENSFNALIADYNSLPKVAGVKIIPDKVNILEGRGIKLNTFAVLTDESTITGIPTVWKCTDPELASVDKNGYLQGKKAGRLRLSVKSGKIGASVSVIIQPVLKSVSVSPNNGLVLVGEALRLSAKGLMSDGAEIPVEADWSLSGSGRGHIDNSGLFTPSSPGQITVTAGSNGIFGTANIDISKAPETRRLKPVVVDNESPEQIVEPEVVNDWSMAPELNQNLDLTQESPITIQIP